MLVYTILALVLGLNASLEYGNRSKRDYQLFNIGLLLILLVSGLRYMHGDYGTYEMGYNEGIDVGGDWGYYQIQLLGKKYWTLLPNLRIFNNPSCSLLLQKSI